MAQEPEPSAPVASPGSRPVLHGELMPLLEASLDFFGTLVRTPNGLYRDAWRVDSPSSTRSERHGSVAAVGVGLMALCIDHELGRDPDAGAKALQTLRTINGKVPGFHPSRDASGFFQHFFDTETGWGRPVFSTVDTAILTVGALFCRNTFDDPAVRDESDELWNSIDWPIALAKPDGSRLYMVVRDGAPVITSVTHLFNEYFILAWLIREWEIQHHGASDIVTIDRLPDWSPRNLLLDRSESDHDRVESSFVVQFPLYMCHPCTTDSRYHRYTADQARADHEACRKRTGIDKFWGCGAGATPRKHYFASSFANNPGNVVSPRIIAGFMPVYPPARDHLLKLYRDPARRLPTPAGDLLPRFSVDQPDWRPRRIEAIDFSSMLFGLAAMHPDLGMAFFERSTRFTFQPPAR